MHRRKTWKNKPNQVFSSTQGPGPSGLFGFIFFKCLAMDLYVFSPGRRLRDTDRLLDRFLLLSPLVRLAQAKPSDRARRTSPRKPRQRNGKKTGRPKVSRETSSRSPQDLKKQKQKNNAIHEENKVHKEKNLKLFDFSSPTTTFPPMAHTSHL